MIIGGWLDKNSPDGYSIAFNEDGTYHWGIPIATLDPNCGSGTYSTLADTLIKIENGWFSIDTSRYIFEVDRKNLKLISRYTGSLYLYQDTVVKMTG